MAKPQIGSCSIAEPRRTQALFLDDSYCLESISLRLDASCSVSSWGSPPPAFDGSELRRVMSSFRDIATHSLLDPDFVEYPASSARHHATSCFCRSIRQLRSSTLRSPRSRAWCDPSGSSHLHSSPHPRRGETPCVMKFNDGTSNFGAFQPPPLAHLDKKNAKSHLSSIYLC